ncbi:aminopeptidase [Candidatus Mycosynbacter amalyticus]|uniref:Aminopeptidase n=1 Tax=Candidatus Mycosynbacter amalyticus TaxID=2665156 RepID=A0A857MK33_9BACT|nr:M1 family metallopeptidase [Candidatus Mycosynbacter amalyticus]QHN42913.1 aminopeptidase [Candidatus Mycosynbacter amalyticus]
MQAFSHLLDSFVPEHYDLSLTLEREARAFHGTISIKGFQKSDDYLPLHTKDLTITSAAVDGNSVEYEHSDNDELRLAHTVPGAHIIVLQFEGKITDAMHGLYPCYFEVDGIKKELLATQFESHHAREVFPCIDEPAAKATFDLTLTTEEGVEVLGNMPVDWQRSEPEGLVTKFETSPRMSSYLLAFVVGEMQKKTAQTKDGVEVNVWATHAQPASALDFPLDIAVRSIEFYNDYFGTPYPLPKADHVALPDFSSGAMENWGLITYREMALLADPATTSISSRQYIATVIAHELAHQWFGNLVTMKWWNDLWLNESFATLMEYIAVDALHPEWNIWLDFATNETISALRRDALDGVQAVQVDVNHPDEISTLFDPSIVYAKGARLLRMVQHYVGHEAFQRGLAQYFRDYAYDNTVGDNLWQALADASGKDIVDMMNIWASQSGYPVVEAGINADSITLTQSQFFIGAHEQSDKLWPIPLGASTEAAPALMTEQTASFDYQSDAPLQLNVGDSAHFITHYDDVLFTRLIDAVKLGQLDTLAKVQLLDEATLLARGGILSSEQLIPLIDAYRAETSEPVWNIIALALGELKKFVQEDEAAEQKLRAFAKDIAAPLYAELGWNAKTGESEEHTKLRGTILGLTLYGEDEAAIATAKELYTSTKLEALDPELRPLIISSVARYGDEDVVDTLLERYRTSQSAELKQDICVGITSTRIPEKIDELLARIKDPTTVKPQDVARWFVYLIRGRESRAVAWQWVQNNWDWIEQTFGGDKSYDDYPRYSAGGLMTREQLDEYTAFFAPKQNIPALTRAIQLGIGEITGRVELIERDQPAVIAALKDL